MGPRNVSSALLLSAALVAGSVAVAPSALAAKTLSVTDAAVVEADAGTAMTFTISLSKKATKKVTVQYTTIQVTTTEGLDYTDATGIAVIKPGKRKARVTVPISGDNLSEIDETFTITLSNPRRAAIGDGTATGTVVDDESDPNLIITEFLANPAAVDDTSHEFIEYHNAGTETVDLSGVGLARPFGMGGSITSCVLGGGTTLASGANHVVSPDVTISDTNCIPTLPNVGTEIWLWKGTAFRFDTVIYDAPAAGQSTSLDPESYSATANNTNSNWCFSTTPYGAVGDKGTPGALNEQCP
jgi:hypothetical protein